MIKKRIILFIIFCSVSYIKTQTFSIARIHYNGGGDWYSDPSSIPNLLNYLDLNTPISVYPNEVKMKLTDDKISQYP